MKQIKVSGMNFIKEEGNSVLFNGFVLFAESMTRVIWNLE